MLIDRGNPASVARCPSRIPQGQSSDETQGENVVTNCLHWGTAQLTPSSLKQHTSKKLSLAIVTKHYAMKAYGGVDA
jgi:hypothetical protein